MTKSPTEITMEKIRAEWGAPLRAEIADLQSRLDGMTADRDECYRRAREVESRLDQVIAACRAMADDGWLMHGPEGMSEPQKLLAAVVERRCDNTPCCRPAGHDGLCSSFKPEGE
jgi:hypothetical protein